jgi:hypothetical protein
MLFFISDEKFVGTSAVEELVAGRFLSAKTKGFFINSSCSGLLNAIEKELKLDFTKIDLLDFV